MKYQMDIDGFIGPYAYSKQYVKQKLSENVGKEVAVRLNSLGGSLDHGLDMAAQFNNHGNVTVYMFGFNASAATIASLGAKQTLIDANGFYLIHKVLNWVDAWGMMNADQLQATITELEKNKKENDKIDLVLARMYAKKSGKKVDEILSVLKKGGWLTAQEALDYGFVDGIITGGEKTNFTDQLKEKFNAFGLPLPPSATPEDSKSLFNLIAKGFKSLGDRLDKSEKENRVTNPQTPVTMAKADFKEVNTLLNIKEITFVDGKANFTEEQIQKLNERLDELAKENKAKDNQIKNLKNGAGDDTTHIHDEGDDDDEEKDNSVFATSKELFNQVKDLIN